MLLYRVFHYRDGAPSATPGSPDYLHIPAQGRGRLDNPRRYLVWYLARDASGAVGEVFGDLDTWQDSMFEVDKAAGIYRALGTYKVPDDIQILNLDHAF